MFSGGAILALAKSEPRRTTDDNESVCTGSDAFEDLLTSFRADITICRNGGYFGVGTNIVLRNESTIQRGDTIGGKFG